MHTTRVSLIRQLSAGESDAWTDLDRVYRPMIRNWLQRLSVSADDADDITQEVMALVVRDIAKFEHNGRIGAFRNWLRTTAVNLARNHLRRGKAARGSGSTDVNRMLAELEDPHSSLSHDFDIEHDRCVVRMLLAGISRHFEPITIEIFRTHVVEDCPAGETARRLGVPIASVHTAKSRVLRRLREVARDWIDDMYF